MPEALADALHTTGAVREFHADPVGDAIIHRILETARFAPSGGNRQGWRVILVKDRARRRRLRDIYLIGWYEYLAQSAAGVVPWAPVGDRDAEAAALAHAGEIAAEAAGGPGGFAEHLDEVPVILVVLADLRLLAAVDRDLPRYTMAGGASIYPFVWSILLAARAEGLAGVMTTMVVREESSVRELLDIPGHFAVAGLVALGRPLRRPARLRRLPVESFTTLDSFGGDPFHVD